MFKKEKFNKLNNRYRTHAYRIDGNFYEPLPQTTRENRVAKKNA